MKKNVSIVLIVLCILTFFTLILSAQETKYDFRKTNWGMSMEQVKAVEDAELFVEIENDTFLYYSGINIAGKDSVCLYFFLEDKLYNSGYVFNGEHSNKNLYIDDYKGLKEMLISKYGEPDNKKLLSLYNRGEIYWTNDLYKDDKSNWGLAISKGDLSYISIWETSTTEIALVLDGDNYKIYLHIGYASKELKEWANKIKEEEAKEDF